MAPRRGWRAGRTAAAVAFSIALAAGPAGDAGGDAPPLYVWPVDDPVAAQTYATPRAHPGMSRRYDAGIDIHAGVDIRPGGAGTVDFTFPVFAAADGWIERLIPYGKDSRGMGNTVILRHADGLYSLYGHLDFFTYGLKRGAFVERGRFLGNMGNSGYRGRTIFLTHVHFEIKSAPVIGDDPGPPRYIGYTPGHPDLYGYVDPRILVEEIPVEPHGPEALRVLPPEGADLRGSPGETYLGAASTPLLDRLMEGQSWVAVARAFVEGRFWYFVHLPSDREPLTGSRYPVHGPTGGWVDGDLVEPDPLAAVAVVARERVRIRSCPDRRCPTAGWAFRDQVFATSGPQQPGRGCRAGWHAIPLPDGAPARDGWICGAALRSSS